MQHLDPTQGETGSRTEANAPVPAPGQTRSAIHATHLLHTPESFVRAALPGMSRATAIIHAAPALGAGFLQYTAEIEAGGSLGVTSAQRFVYQLSGVGVVHLDGEQHPLTPGGYAYLPQGCDHRVVASSAATVAVIEKAYEHLDGIAAPSPLLSHEQEATSDPLMGDASIQVRPLLPGDVAFDFAVNVMTYEPGASLPMVEVHIMEHGLLMLEGAGIYRLANNWYPVTEGDFIWMASFCPQWFGALGKTPAKYLIYKNWNRAPALR